MSIGIFTLALLMIAFPGSCLIEHENTLPPAIDTPHEMTNTTGVVYTTTTLPSHTETFFVSPKSLEVAHKLPTKSEQKGDLVSGIWPVKHSAEVDGDLILGGLMMVHEREDTVTCGPIMPQGGVQALEAMLYTLDVVNKLDILPNITVGAHILDDCDKDTYGLEMAVDFIKGDPLERKVWRAKQRSVH